MKNTTPVKKIIKSFFFKIIALQAALLMPTTVMYTLPAGIDIINGDVQMHREAQNLNFNISSNKAIIEYDNFDIGLNEAVNFDFHTPSPGSSVVLNRIVNSNPSAIYGSLQSNGKVFLINPYGILFGPSAVVDAASFIGSTLDLSSDNFLQEQYIFEGTTSSSIENYGTITAREKGFAALISNNITNNGEINIRLGTVALATGNKVILDFTGDGIINFALPKNIDDNTVIDTGKARKIVSGVLNTEECIQADTIVKEKGIIQLVANKATNTITNEGTITANDGSVDIVGNKVVNNATINAANIDIIANEELILDNNSVIDNRNHCLDGDVYLYSFGDSTAYLNQFLGLSGNGEFSAYNHAAFDGTVTGDGLFIIDPATAEISGDYSSNATVWAEGNVAISGNVTIGASTTLNVFADHNSETSGDWHDGSGAIVNNSTYTISGTSGIINFKASTGIGTSGNPILSEAITSAEIQSGYSNDIYINSLPAGDLQINDLSTDGIANLTSQANVTITGTVNTTSSFWNIDGSWENSGTFATSYPSVIFNGAGDFEITSGGSNFNDLTFNNGSGTWTQTDNMIVNNDFILTGGTFKVADDTTSSTLPTFSVGNDFQIIPGTTFHRYVVDGTTRQIRDIYDLQAITTAYDFDVVADFDASETANWNSGKGFVPVLLGTAKTFDGQNNTITGLTINLPTDDYVGLFGDFSTPSLINNTIQNIGLIDCDITGNDYVGALVAYSNSTTITECYSTGDIKGINRVGGLVGENDTSSITNSYSTVDIDGYAMVGGLVGENISSSTIENCYATGDISGLYALGGLTGSNDGLSTIRNSYAIGSVSASNGWLTGGLTGSNSTTSTIEKCYATGAITGAAFMSGGLVGDNSSSTVSQSYYDTNTTGQSDTGKGEPISTANMKKLSTFTGWNFSSPWKINEDKTYPYLVDLQYVVGGTTTYNGPVGLAIEGTELGTSTPDSNDFYYFLASKLQYPSDHAMIIYMNDGINQGNVVTTCSANDITDLSLILNRVIASNETSSDTTVSDFVLAKGNLTDNDILFTATTNSLTIANNMDFEIASGKTFDLDDDTLTLSNGNTFYNNGTFKLVGNNTINYMDYDNSAGTVEYTGTGSYTGFAAGNDYYNLTLAATNYTLDANLDVNGTLTLPSSGVLDLDTYTLANTTLSNDGTLKLIGSQTMNSFNNDTNSGTVEYTGTGSYTGFAAGNDYYNLTLAATNYTLDANLDVNGTLTLPSSGVLDLDTYTLANTILSNDGTLKLIGSQTMNSFNNDTDSGTVEYTGTGSYTGFAAGNDYYNLTLAAANYTLDANLDVNGTLTLPSSGVLDLDTYTLANTILSNDGTLKLVGSQTMNSFNNDTDSGTVEYTGTGSYTGLAAGNIYYDVMFTNGSYATTSNLTVNNSLSSSTLDNITFGNNVTAPIIELITDALAFNGGTGSIDTDILNIYTTAINKSINIETTGIGTLDIAQTSLSAIAADTVVTIGKTNGTGKITVGQASTFSSPTTLKMNGNGGKIYVNADITGQDSLNFISGTNTTYLAADIATEGATIQFDGDIVLTDNVSVSTTANSSTGNNITFNDTVDGDYDLTLIAGVGDITFNNAIDIDDLAVNSAQDVIIDDTITATSSTLTANTIDLRDTITAPTISISGDLVINGAYTAASNGTTTIVGNFNQSAGTFTAPSTTLTLSGNFTHSGGTFNHNDGTVIFDNSSTTSNITGTTTFKNFSCSTAGKTLNFDATGTQTFSELLTLQGSATTPVTIYSSVTGSPANINANTASASYLDVKDSNNIGTQITARYSSDNGNNTGWYFPAGTYTWTGSKSANWDDKDNWDSGTVPVSDSDVVIASSTTYSPSLQSAVTLANLTINNDAELSLNDWDMTISNSFTNNGTLYQEGGETFSATSITNNGYWTYIGNNIASILNLSKVDYYNLTVSPRNEKNIFNVLSNTNTDNDFSITAGLVDTQGYHFVVDGEFNGQYITKTLIAPKRFPSNPDPQTNLELDRTNRKKLYDQKLELLKYPLEKLKKYYIDPLLITTKGFKKLKDND